jgi:hypothetical protein
MRRGGNRTAVSRTLAAVFNFLRARVPSVSDDGNLITPEMPSNKPPQFNAHDDGSNAVKRRLSGAIRRTFPWLLLIISAGLIVLAGVRYIYLHYVEGYALALVSLALTSFLTIRPRQGRIDFITKTALVFFFIEFAFVLEFAVLDILTDFNPGELLQLVLIGMGALAIALFVAVTWMPKSRFKEPLALGLFAIGLGAICIAPVLQLIGNGLPRLTNLNDSGFLFSSGPADQPLSLDVQVDPLSDQPNKEVLRISNLGNLSIHWALLLTGGAQLSAISHGSSRLGQQSFAMGNSMSFISPQTQAQLLWGVVNGNSSTNFTGTLYRNFLQSVSGNAEDRSLVALPSYGQWTYPLYYPGAYGDTVGGYAAKLIITALGSNPPVMTKFTVVVSGGHLPPFDTLAQVSPPMAPDPKDPTELRWTTSGWVRPYYETLAQGVDVNGILFVFAVLLGVAGSALIVSLQTTIQALSSPHPAAAADGRDGGSDRPAPMAPPAHTGPASHAPSSGTPHGGGPPH